MDVVTSMEEVGLQSMPLVNPASSDSIRGVDECTSVMTRMPSHSLAVRRSQRSLHRPTETQREIADKIVVAVPTKKMLAFPPPEPEG